jgi:hypothetical protein
LKRFSTSPDAKKSFSSVGRTWKSGLKFDARSGANGNGSSQDNSKAFDESQDDRSQDNGKEAGRQALDQDARQVVIIVLRTNDS